MNLDETEEGATKELRPTSDSEFRRQPEQRENLDEVEEGATKELRPAEPAFTPIRSFPAAYL